MECYSYLRNVQDEMADAQTTLEKRFWKTIDGPFIPFGASMELSVWKHMLKEISFGCVLRAGVDVGQVTPSWLIAEIFKRLTRQVYVKRFRIQEMSVTMLYGCPCAK